MPLAPCPQQFSQKKACHGLASRLSRPRCCQTGAGRRRSSAPDTWTSGLGMVRMGQGLNLWLLPLHLGLPGNRPAPQLAPPPPTPMHLYRLYHLNSNSRLVSNNNSCLLVNSSSNSQHCISNRDNAQPRHTI